MADPLAEEGSWERELGSSTNRDEGPVLLKYGPLQWFMLIVEVIDG